MAEYTSAHFDKAVALIGALPADGPVKPSQDDKLVFYANFKQANAGDNTTPKPGMMDFVGKAKWNAWEKVKGKSTEQAKSDYVAHFVKVLDAAGADGEATKAELLGAK